MMEMKQVSVRVTGIIIFFLQVAGQIHAQKVKDMNCHLAKLTTPMICQVPKILQKGEDDKLHHTSDSSLGLCLYGPEESHPHEALRPEDGRQSS